MVRFIVCGGGTAVVYVVSSSTSEEVLGRCDRTDCLRYMLPGMLTAKPCVLQ